MSDFETLLAEAEALDEEPLGEGLAAHQKKLDAIEKKLAVIERLEDQNDRNGSLLQFVKSFTKGEKKLMDAVKACITLHSYWGSLPPGMGTIREALWKRAAKAASRKMDFHYWKVVAERLSLPVVQ